LFLSEGFNSFIYPSGTLTFGYIALTQAVPNALLQIELLAIEVFPNDISHGNLRAEPL
jgi:hypothetical protein